MEYALVPPLTPLLLENIILFYFTPLTLLLNTVHSCQHSCYQKLAGKKFMYLTASPGLILGFASDPYLCYTRELGIVDLHLINAGFLLILS